MQVEKKSDINILKQKRKWLTILLCSIYCTFLSLLIGIAGKSRRTAFQSNLVELSGVLFMLGIYIVIPITLIVFLYILIGTRNISSKNEMLMGEIPATLVVISLMVVSFITGVIIMK